MKWLSLSLVPLCLGATVHNPKVASMAPHPFSVPLVSVQVITNQVRWNNAPPPSPPTVTNILRYSQIGTTNTNSIAMKATNTALVVAPSNSIAMQVFSQGANGALSMASVTLTNNIAPAQPVTNVWQVQPLFSTDLTNWQPSGAPWYFTNIGLSGKGFFRLGLAKQ